MEAGRVTPAASCVARGVLNGASQFFRRKLIRLPPDWYMAKMNRHMRREARRYLGRRVPTRLVAIQQKDDGGKAPFQRLSLLH